MKTRLKKLTSLMLTAAMTAGTMTGMTAFTAEAEDNKNPIQKEFYVSVNGDDANDGSENAPFATVEKAREAVDAINDDMTGDIIVNIKEGIYYLDKTIQLGKSDSGTNGHEVIYRSVDGLAKASLKGGQKVEKEWTLATQDDVDNFDMSADMLGKVYKVDLGEETPDFNTLYVNGKRATMARTQNRQDSERFPASKDTYMYAAGGSRKNIKIRDGAVTEEQMDAMKNALSRGEEAAQVYAWESGVQNWFTSTLPIAAIDGNTLKFPASPADNPQLYEPKYPFWAEARYFLQGNLSFLDVPGEYHYNKKTNVLYYYPKSGEENLAEQEVVYPVLQEIFSLKGDEKAKITDAPVAENQVHNVTFQGLEMGYTEFGNSYSSAWNAFDSGMGGSLNVFPPEALQEGITQPSYCEQTERKEHRKGVLTLSQTNHITVDSARIINTGLQAISAWGDNNNLTVKDSEIAHIGVHGINIDGGYPGPDVGKYSYGHVITNNIIHDMGELAGHGTGLQILQTHDSEFSYMEMYNAARRAIFLEGAWWNRTSEERQKFNRLRDAHTYNNHLDYLYLHDLQQDGGDDGAIFVSTLYGTQDTGTDYTEDQYKRNYLNQIYMDNVGAPSSNKDYKPNCINLDMGCKGATLSNFKAVNPEHYNVRWDENDPDVFFENVNMAYYHPKKDSNYTNFDESKMEYEKIGVKASFPYKDAVTTVVGKADKTDAEYKDLYFRDEFDNGLDNWWKLAGKPGTSPLYYSDNDDRVGNSFLADAFYGANKSAEGCLIGKPFGTDLNKIVEIDFFDHTNDGMENGYCGMSFQYHLNSFARVDNGKRVVAIGADTNRDFSHYAYKVGSITKMTDVPRSYGWHTFKWDYTSGKDVKLYIDDQLIATVPGTSFNYIEMGDYGQGGFNAYDNVVIYDGKEAAAPIPLPEPPEKEEPEVTIPTLPGRIEAEDAVTRNDTTVIEDVPGGGKAIAYISKGDVYTYDLEVTEDCELPMTVGFASNGAASFTLEIGDQTIEVTMPYSGGWQKYTSMTTDPVKLTKGKYTAKITVINNNFNIDYFAFNAPKEAVKVEEVIPTVNGGKLVLSKGNEVNVPYTVKPSNAENKNVVWSTDDENVVTVADGTIKAVAEGTANVTVAAEENAEIKATFAVVVKDMEASLISTTENGCVPSSPDYDHVNYKPEKLIDGDLSKGWATNGKGPLENKVAYLEWAEPQTVNTIYLYDVAEATNYVSKMEIIFNDDPTDKIVLENGVPDGGMEVVELPKTKTDVTKIEFRILDWKAMYNNCGFAEIKVFSEKPGQVPVNAISVEKDTIAMLNGGTATMKLPVIVPSTATDKSYKVELVDGNDVITLTANSTDGIVHNYTVKALKEGTAVIRVTAGTVTKDVTVVVGSTGALEDLIIAAEDLYARYEGETEAHKAFEKAIKEAVAVYEESEDIDVIADAIDSLNKAMKAFEDAMNQPEEKDTFTITVDGTSKEYAYNDAVTVEAAPEKDGAKFVCWMAGDEVVSYKAVYKFYASKNMTLTAVYEDEVVEEAKATATLANVFVEERADGKLNVKFVGELVLPEGYKVLEAGLVWSSKDTPLTVDGKLNPDLKPTKISKISDTNQFSVTIKGMPADKYIRGAIFAKVADKDGKTAYIFSTEGQAGAVK